MAGVSLTFAVVLAAYTAVVLLIGVFGYRRIKTEDDFLTASRSIGPWVGGAVLAATQISAGTFVGTVGRHYGTGVSWVWIWPGLWLGWLASALFVAPKLRQFGAATVPDYLATRYNSPAARLLSALVIIFAYTVLLTAQYQACGEIFQVLFGVPPVYAMALLMLSTLFYTMLGGVRSSSYIDFLQTLIMVAGLMMAIPVLLAHTGGLRLAGELLHSLDPRLTGWWYGGKEILGFSLAFGLTMAAAPYEMARYYSMRDAATVRQAIGVNFLFQALIGSGVLVLGLLMRVAFPRLASWDQASTVMALNLLSPIAGSLFLVAMISAIMSTCNSILLVTAAGVSHDIYAKLIRPEASEHTKLLLNRIGIVALGAAPVWFALQHYSDVQSIVVLQTEFIASFFFVPTVFGLNSRYGTRQGTLASMAGGFLGCLAWSLWGTQRYPTVNPAEVGIGAGAVLYFAVSKWSRS